METKTDTQLVQASLQQGDHRAFAELVDRHKSGVFALLRRTLGSGEEVIEDIAQNVFLAVFRGLRAFRQDAKFSTWLYRITYNQACSALRKKRTLDGKMTSQMSVDEDGKEIEYESTGDNDPAKKLLIEQVWSTVEKLPPQSKAVIELYYGRGLIYPEIAEVLNVPLGTVKTHLHRARARLREVLVEKKD